MSFSTEVKNELSSIYVRSMHCNLSELSAILQSTNMLENYEKYGIFVLQCENIFTIRRICVILTKIFNCNINVSCKRMNKQAYISTIYSVSMLDKKIAQQIIYLLNSHNIDKTCCKRAYIRGFFICNGSINDPQKAYHLEFVCSNKKIANKLSKIINSFNIKAKIIERKTQFVVYIKESESIVDLIKVIEAPVSLMELENMRIVKSVRNDINRIVNCETANTYKIATAFAKHIEDINFIDEKIGIHTLPEQLEQVAKIRLENPYASLKEIGTMLIPMIGKSGVNHRLRKISEIAENLKEEKI